MADAIYADAITPRMLIVQFPLFRRGQIRGSNVQPIISIVRERGVKSIKIDDCFGTIIWLHNEGDHILLEIDDNNEHTNEEFSIPIDDVEELMR